MHDPSIPPSEIRTARLLLRCWSPEDAPRFKAALDASLAEVARWIPWARKEPSPLADIVARLEGFRADFHGGRNALYAMTDPAGDDVLGGIGLYRRVGPGRIEIGYWVRTDQAGKGLATEAATALTRVAFTLEGIDAVEIRCDVANEPSNAIPRKLAYRHARTIEEDPDPDADGRVRRTVIWELTREEFETWPADG
ncbi:MAG: GNAT family N-acetyltransferase [Gemmatimonadota bacterium]|nr:GNAT family N-acetyltransferase [Gemmatimonadota bacterium]